MKKTKIITFSLLGLLLLVPFMRPSRAQVPSHVGVAVGDEFAIGLNIYIDTWTEWNADNMEDFWGTAWALGPLNLTGIFETGYGSPPDQIIHYEITSIVENTTTGNTEINSTFGMEFPAWQYTSWSTASNTISNNTAGFAADDMWYGLMAVGWNPPYVPFIPTTVNWTEFAEVTNYGMGDGLWFITTPVPSFGYGYDITAAALTNGFTLSSPAMGFGNNSLAITITTTYNSDGVLTYNSFEYGTNLLYEYELLDIDDPIVTAAPSDFSVDHDYTGETISWTATDANPNTYTVSRNGTVVLNATAWTSGTAVQFSVPDGLTAGDHGFEITFTDDEGNSVTDEVVMTVGPAPPAAIPGYETSIVLGAFTIATIGLIILVKKKK